MTAPSEWAIATAERLSGLVDNLAPGESVVLDTPHPHKAGEQLTIELARRAGVRREDKCVVCGAVTSYALSPEGRVTTGFSESCKCSLCGCYGHHYCGQSLTQFVRELHEIGCKTFPVEETDTP